MAYLYRFLAYHKLILLILQIMNLYIGKSTPFYYILTILLLLFFLSNYPIKIYTNKTSLLIKIIFAPWLKIYLIAKKALGGRSLEWNDQKLFTRKSIKAGQQTILIKYRGREKKRSSTIDFKAFVFFFVYVYTLWLLYFRWGLYQNGENHHFI